MIPMDKTAQIRAEVITRSHWSDIWVPWPTIDTICDFWTAWSGTLRRTDAVRESRTDAYEVIIPLALRDQVKAGMFIKLFDKDGTTRGSYKIDTTDELELWNNDIDNVLLNVSAING